MKAGPRWDVRGQTGRWALELAEPLAAPWGKLAKLVVEYPDLPPEVDLRAGAKTFQHRRGFARSAEAIIEARALCTQAELQGYDLRLEAASAERGIRISLHDDVGAIDATITAKADGADIVIMLDDIASDSEGQTSQQLRLQRAAQRLMSAQHYGADWDHGVGGARMANVGRRLLAEALAPMGWRIPATPHQLLRVANSDRGFEISWAQ